MAKSFFETIEVEEPMVHKSIAMASNDWNLIEAYLLFGATKRKKKLSLQKIIRKILVKHIEGDREFIKEYEIWSKKLGDLKEAANDEAH
jgi:hypothetical protein